MSEDVVQEVFVAIWLKRATLNIVDLGAYLHTAIRFQVLKAIRDGKGRVESSGELENLMVNANIESDLTIADITQRLDESIATLPVKCKEIFILSRKQHLTTAQIADKLNLSMKTVENQITIALRRIRLNMVDLLFWLLLTSLTYFLK